MDLTVPAWPLPLQIGYGLPMHQGAAGSRYILFGSFDKLGRNIGILFAWLVGVGSIIVLMAIKARRLCFRMRTGAPAYTDPSPPGSPVRSSGRR